MSGREGLNNITRITKPAVFPLLPSLSSVQSLSYDSGHNVFDRPVFARRIHGLENEQDSPLVLGIKFVLQIGECLHPLGQRYLGAVFVLFVKGEQIVRTVIFEPEIFSRGHPERAGQFVGFFDQLIGFHGDAQILRQTAGRCSSMGMRETPKKTGWGHPDPPGPRIKPAVR